MQTVLSLLAWGWLAAAATMVVLWLVQLRTRNAGIVDVAWAALTGSLGVYFALATSTAGWLRWLAGGMIAAWSLRLTIHLARRVLGAPEEGRYQTLRKNWRQAANRRFFWFFQGQALAAVGLATSVLAVAVALTPPPPWLVAVGVVLWVVGVGGVALADAQLSRFKRRPESQKNTCREGLWQYSRHPNYFFEWLHWCAYIPLATGSLLWWAPISVSAALLYLLLFVTGIPPTEAQALASRGEDYRDYQRTTSKFVPWFPSNSTSTDAARP